ncbi:MbtH family NRPS accessory protein [Streptomyces sp. NPDC091201]|uniref:MbtH family protein n=1 Tax=Streptomyces sp. NPDC091201 TaxID=3155190 RepID=UPI00341E1C98
MSQNVTYEVVRNEEEQYSLWEADRELPPGWSHEGTRGTREECVAHIDRVWTDIRPRSVRERQQAAARASQA